MLTLSSPVAKTSQHRRFPTSGHGMPCSSPTAHRVQTKPVGKLSRCNGTEVTCGCPRKRAIQLATNPLNIKVCMGYYMCTEVSITPVISQIGSYFGSSSHTERIGTYYKCQYNVQWTEQLTLSCVTPEPHATETSNFHARCDLLEVHDAGGS